MTHTVANRPAPSGSGSGRPSGTRRPIATDDPDFDRFITRNGADAFASLDGYVAHHARRAYARTPVMPAYDLEGPDDEEHTDGTNVNPPATQPVRRFQWWGWLGSIGGHLAGNGYVWPFRDELWTQHLDTRGAQDMAILNALVVSLPWHTLVPSALGGQRELIIKDGSHERAPDDIAAPLALRITTRAPAGSIPPPANTAMRATPSPAPTASPRPARTPPAIATGCWCSTLPR